MKKLEVLIKSKLISEIGIEENFSVKISKQKLGYKLTIKFIDSDEKLVLFAGTLEDELDESEIMYLFIKDLYATEINWRTKYIRDTKNFLYRKAKQLATWSARNNIDKITKINTEIIERYRESAKTKIDADYYKEFVKAFYSIKNQLEDTEVA